MRKIKLSLLLLVLVLGVVVSVALADGTETLGTPSIAIASGSGIAVGGAGTVDQPGTINVDVPAGATVNQVLLYWSGEFKTAAANDDTINVGGSAVTGAVIGGPTVWYTLNQGTVDVLAVSYRADITDLGLIGPGANAVQVDGMDFDHHNHGAGILVIYEEPDMVSELTVLDGSDLAFYNFDPSLDTTVPQTFNFAAADSERTLPLNIFAGSVGERRPNIVMLESGGVVTPVVNPLFSADGALWDTITLQAVIPAGATSLTVQVLSESETIPPKPASLNWVGAALTVPVPETPEEPGGGQGCTPGYWKTKKHQKDWAATGFSQGDDFDTTFNVDFFDPDRTLFEGAWSRGGKLNRAARHGTAALLNASHPDVDYDLTVAQVITAVQNGEIDMLEGFNEQETPGFCD